MKLPSFYGWMIVAIAHAGGISRIGVSHITLAVVLKPISDHVAGAGLFPRRRFPRDRLAPVFGPMADRLAPPRSLLLAGAGVVGFGSLL